ncbi:alpha-L-fucosidase [Brachybacterium huguangmaarense]|uniref:alpha-L-fucosidase n=1 Tax=Brachybacterium huguangmaarense TaxID=1652028 RepID=A0ABY6G0L8_9MICO|nr:alpha-L-fucosidase [Brachybacterium huguangmaarense]UYG16652.1 alpha-L-fucosidase [Brachybacterium huguangmaarense]
MTTSPSTDAQAWFDQARFGLFVHFGLYAVPARHEWSMTRERRTVEDYSRYADVFDPDRFDARAIARRAREAGMRYAVLTTKHHEGFCLFETAETTYSAPDVCGRDLVREWVDALRAEGLQVGFYYSLLDWHHPDYTIDMQHPLRDTGDWDELNADRDMARYRDYLFAQVRELLTGYGTIDYLFFDFTYGQEGGKFAEDWDAEALLALCRTLQPAMIVNDRLGIPGDLVTPEQYQPASPMTDASGAEVRWEACQTTNGSWGYDRDNHDFKSADLLVRMLVDSVAKNGNLLLNVGPDGRGGLRTEDAEILEELSAWMELHGDAVHGAGAARGLEAPQGTVLTRRGDRLYVHLTTWPMQHLHLPGLAGRVRFARLLHDGSEVRFTTIDPAQQAETTTVGGLGEDVVTLTLPIRRPDVLLPVVELRIDDAPTGAAPVFGSAIAPAAAGLV